MSHRLLAIPKINNVSTFNFFFNNTKKNLIEQNFIGNQFLASPYGNFPVLPRAIKLSTRKDRDTSLILQNVASKVLSCQDSKRSELDSSNQQHAITTSIPFEVIPKKKNAKHYDNSTKVNHISYKSLLNPYLKLTKPNLTILVTLSSICSYAISPNSVSLPELLFLTLGTALCSGSANAINMGREPAYDRKMTRTIGRPVVRGLVTPGQAFKFAAISGTLGCGMLYYGVNLTVAALGLSNIVLYSWIYTTLKRKSIINTWVGAVVGSLPPLMGWAASSSLSHPGAWCLAALLYAWQFPHFNSLSHNIADQYRNAGYVMTAAENPKLNARVALRYSILMFPICFGLSYFGITDWFFTIDSSIANVWLTYLAYQFWRQQQFNYSSVTKPTDEGLALANLRARKLFWCSVWQLPCVLILAMIHKKGQWDRILSTLGIIDSNVLI